MTGLRVAAIAAAAVMASCASPQGGAGDRSGSGDTATIPAGDAEGVVRVVGSAPVDVHVVVEDEDGEAVRVVGALRDEIRRLTGARVVLRGRVADSEHPIAARQIDATGYEIVSVGGQPVLQGVVQGRTGGWTVLHTTTGDTIYLSSLPESVRPGQRVWVQGQRSLIVRSHGVLRD